MLKLKLITALAFAAATVSASAADMAVLRNGFEIRHERREQLGAITRLYVAGDSYVDVATDQIAAFEAAPDPSPELAARAATLAPQPAPDLHQLVNAAADRHQVDADFIASVIRAESGFDPRARSPKGAQGLMQLMPGTASKLGVTDAYQPDANIDAGTRYLRELLVQYNGDMVKALAAYNAGPHRVAQYRGVPPYRETHAYVARIVRDFNRKKVAQQHTEPAARKPVKSGKAPAPTAASPGMGQ